MSDESEYPLFSKGELLRRIDSGWEQLQAYIASLVPEQITQPTDAAGWTVKDHLIHLARWESGVIPLLTRGDRLAEMGVAAETWARGHDAINALMQQRDRDLPLPAVLQQLENAHQRLHAQIEAMDESQLTRPHRDYVAGSTEDDPIWGWIVGNSFGHYEEHTPWMQAIAGGR